MRSLFAFLLLFAATAASAQVEADSTQWVTGRGSYTSFCSGNDYFCLDNVKRTARRYAEQDAEMTCRSMGGNPQTWSASCREFCRPYYIPPDSQDFATCDMDCSLRCEMTDTYRIDVQ